MSGVGVALGLSFAGLAHAQPAAPLATATIQPAVSPADRALHERLLTLDTHLDTPINFGRAGWDMLRRHDADPFSQVDLPRMVEGGLDGGFFAIYTAQAPLTPQGYAGARTQAIVRSAQIREMAARHAAKFALAYTAADAPRIAAAGKRVVYQSIENSYPMGEDLGLFSTFQALGVRMAGPVHYLANQFADSSTDKPRWRGLSPLGRRWVAEANRLGVVIDASHASDEAFDQMLALSKTPIILSHSGCKAVFDAPRNLDDTRIRALAAAGGVIQINSVYLVPRRSDPEYKRLSDAMDDRSERIWTLSEAEQAGLIAERRALNARFPPRGDFEDFMRSLLHALKLVGSEHVGIGADWDGGGGVAGMRDVADLPRITARLRAAGYSQADVANIWSGNTLRVLARAEAFAKWGS